jgi:hypothetical protein
MPEFNGFQDTTIVGKADLTVGTSIKKLPQDNTTVHQYVTLPIQPSSSPLSTTMISNLNTITSNTKYEKYSARKYEKLVETLSPEVPLEAIE